MTDNEYNTLIIDYGKEFVDSKIKRPRKNILMPLIKIYLHGVKKISRSDVSIINLTISNNVMLMLMH